MPSAAAARLSDAGLSISNCTVYGTAIPGTVANASCPSASATGRVRLLVALHGLVSCHDALHQRMSHHVSRGEFAETHAIDIAQHTLHVLQTRQLVTRQIRPASHRR